jgi:hypothetical protein
MSTFQTVAKKINLPARETNFLLLRRGPYVIAAGLDESISQEPKILKGRFVNLFDADLRVQRKISVTPGSRYFLLDLDAATGPVLATACKVIPTAPNKFAVEGIVNTAGLILMKADHAPSHATLGGEELKPEFSATEKLLWLKFQNEPSPRELSVTF